MKFTVEINCDNAAFEGDELVNEIGRVLGRLEHRIQYGMEVGDIWGLFDSNGNRVGEAKVTK